MRAATAGAGSSGPSAPRMSSMRSRSRVSVVAPRVAPGAAAFSAVLVAAARRVAAAGPPRRQRPHDALRRAVGLPRAGVGVARARAPRRLCVAAPRDIHYLFLFRTDACCSTRRKRKLGSVAPRLVAVAPVRTAWASLMMVLMLKKNYRLMSR